MSVSGFADGDFLAFAEEFMLRNEPCVFTEHVTRHWKSRKLWQKNGKPDLDYLAREFGMSGLAMSVVTLQILFYTCICTLYKMAITNEAYYLLFVSGLR